ncbi:SPOR domain-containing protein [Plebeiibacterium sediminum]|uniref:SPOR domain-containing protein n=1 Tax=Plebeiibacterium sediminum TaxID=2992112 RepID=A0AAE3SEG5_9BACT|nr:SPOR domain-containing protein [Plebeiobacterium sediminum]MCW3785073.1 SPOR domain-containing protein [Plebeiobacterium sediminum]
MEKYISELIKENNRVIIPNFGAFIISKENGLSILFNNFLSFNDGLLVNYIAEQKGIDTIVATDQVFNYVDNLKKELDEKGIYSIDKLGVFKKDENGILRFQQASDFAEELNSEELTKKEPSEFVNEDTVEVKKETVLLDIDDDSEITDAPEEEKIKEDTSVEKVEEKEPVFTIDKEEEKLIKEEKVPVSVTTPPIPKEQPKVKPATPKEKVVNKYAQKTIKEKKRKDIITFVVIALLVILCIAVYFVFFNNSKKVKVKTTPIKVEKPIKQEPVVIDSAKVVKEEPVEQIETPVQPEISKSKDFYIIVGSFKKQENAENYVNKLKDLGFTNAEIIPKGNMFLVSADSDASYRVIEARQQEILEKDRLESWLYKIQ